MKYSVREINKLIEDIRAGQPPQLPQGTREEHYHDPALPGFYIRVLNTGVASWVVQWKRLGRQKKIALGNLLVLDRMDAIKAGRELLAKITLGTLDPHEARRERMRLDKVTLATVVPLFFKDKKLKGELKPQTERQWTSYFAGYYFKPLHNLPIDEITKEQLQTQIEIIAHKSGSAAETCCTAVRTLFKWAIKTGKLPEGHRNPMTNVQPPLRDAPRDRVLTDDELRLIWKTCEFWEAKAFKEQQFKESTGKFLHKGPPSNTDYPRAIKLLILTGCRAQEIGGLQWAEIDLENGELRIPGSRRKARKSQEEEMELWVPLADWAVQILRGVEVRSNNDFVFCRSRQMEQRRIHRKLAGLYLTGVHKQVDRYIVRAGGTPPPDWTTHDIRRTFRTRMAALGVTADVAEALVGHVGHRTKIDRIYNRHKYWAEKRQAVAMWEANLRAIIDGTAEKIARPRFGEREKKGGAA